MSKKLKKKIEEICGFKDLDWEARQVKAEQILASSEWKQSICNELIGLSFRELERTLSGVATERQKKEDSYERKLEAYKSGRSNRQPKPDSKRKYAEGSEYGTSARKLKSEKAGPRTLKEILAQVHAPRVCEERPSYQLFKRAAGSGRDTSESVQEVLQDSDDGDDSADESVG